MRIIDNYECSRRKRKLGNPNPENGTCIPETRIYGSKLYKIMKSVVQVFISIRTVLLPLLLLLLSPQSPFPTTSHTEIPSEQEKKRTFPHFNFNYNFIQFWVQITNLSSLWDIAARINKIRKRKKKKNVYIENAK